MFVTPKNEEKNIFLQILGIFQAEKLIQQTLKRKISLEKSEETTWKKQNFFKKYIPKDLETGETIKQNKNKYLKKYWTKK